MKQLEFAFKKKNHFSNLNNNLNLREQGHGHRRDIHHIPSDGMARATQLRRLEQPLRQQIQRPQGHKPTKEINKSLNWNLSKLNFILLLLFSIVILNANITVQISSVKGEKIKKE